MSELEKFAKHIKKDVEEPSLMMPMKSTYSAEAKEPTVKQFNGAKTHYDVNETEVVLQPESIQQLRSAFAAMDAISIEGFDSSDLYDIYFEGVTGWKNQSDDVVIDELLLRLKENNEGADDENAMTPEQFAQKLIKEYV